MQNIVLDNIKFPTGKEKDEARFRQIQEERLNRNFRRLLENDANKNSATALPDSIRVGDNIDIYKPTVHHGAVLEQFGSTVTSHSASGNYAKVVTFSTNVQASRNLLYFVNNVVQESNGITLTTHKDGSITINGTATANTNLNLDFGNAGQATFEEIDNGTTYYWSAVVLSGTITGTTPILRGGYYGDAVAQSSAHTVGANSCVSATVPSSGTYYARTYIHFDSGTKLENVVIGVMMTLNNVSAYADYEPYVDATNMDVNKPLTVEYIRTGDTSPTELTIGFTSNYSLASFTSDNSIDAYLHLAGTAKWILYIGKASASDSVEILDFHNPWSNTDMTINWEDSSVSTLPTGYISASKINGMMQCGVKTGSTVAANSYGDFTVTFPTPFPSIPTVCVSLYTSSTGYGMGSVSAVVCVGTVSTTGFTIRCYNNDSVGRNPAYTWIAML